MSDVSSDCIVCHKSATGERVCRQCASRLARNLDKIIELTILAHSQINPSQTKDRTGTGYESRPPLNIAAIDPELASIELWKGDPSSAVPILEMLEMWEKDIRDQRHMAAYGLVSAQRTESTLTGVVGFLRVNIDWMLTHADFNIVEFHDHLHRAVRILSRWDIDRASAGFGLICPNENSHGQMCNAWIRWESGENSTQCHRCGREWNVAWLLRVANDVWLDSDAIAHLTGIPRRTIQSWGRSGKIGRRGLLYKLSDITNNTRQHITA
jgi:hypothetical protein